MNASHEINACTENGHLLGASNVTFIGSNNRVTIDKSIQVIREESSQLLHTPTPVIDIYLLNFSVILLVMCVCKLD